MASLLLAATVATAAPAAPEPAPRAVDDPGELARQILDDGPYQTELPSAEQEMPRGLGGLSELLTALGILLAAGLLLVVVALIVGAFRRGEDSGEAAATGDGRGREGRIAALPSPRALAAAGRYDEAVHALLLHAIERLAHAGSLRSEPSETTRELLRRIPEQAASRRPFADLARSNELSRFGGRPATAMQFDACVAFYRAAVGEEAP